MTTLNARASQAYQEMRTAEDIADGTPAFDTISDAFEEGWETGYKAASEDAANEIERCALVLATENDEAGNYLVAAVLKKAADIVRTSAANGGSS